MINNAFDATKSWPGVTPDADWMGPLYQSANRYATLCFLRKIAGVQAFLVNLYFVGDPISPMTLTAEDWNVAIGCVNRELCLVSEVPYSIKVVQAAE
ncbi:MAG TPA: hypothetical protein VFE02_12275 [Candidatus Acidoferrales bacterium]|nr:hypothetical protein [Candidatus Acidoferrales bacterium]